MRESRKGRASKGTVRKGRVRKCVLRESRGKVWDDICKVSNVRETRVKKWQGLGR